jgi:hypothetical protein
MSEYDAADPIVPKDTTPDSERFPHLPFKERLVLYLAPFVFATFILNRFCRLGSQGVCRVLRIAKE